MQKFAPPVCLFLALAALISGFAMMAVPEPEPGMALHEARVSGDEEYERLLEDDLERRRWWRRAAIGGLFAAAVLFTVTAFLAMEGSRVRVPSRDESPPACE